MNDKEVLERLEKSISSLSESVGELSLKIKELDERTSFPINKSLNKTSNPMKKIQAMEDHFKMINYGTVNDVSYPSLKLKDTQVNRNSKHYYENGMPRLDKYLAYLEIESGYFRDGVGRFLITKDFNLEFTMLRFPDAENNFIRVNFRGLVDTKFYKKRTIQFKFGNTGTLNLDYLDSIQHSFNRVVDELTNGKNINTKSIYNNVENEFRTIKVKDWGNITVTIENTIYSSYGAMNENRPLYKETIYGQADIRVYE